MRKKISYKNLRRRRSIYYKLRVTLWFTLLYMCILFVATLLFTLVKHLWCLIWLL